MKREDYLVTTSMGYLSKVAELINEKVNTVFDDLESRTCENCEHFSGANGWIQFACLNDKTVQQDDTGEWTKRMFVYEYFGCNKFERKNAKNS